MKLNRIFSALVLTGLLSGAGMAAQAQTRIMVRIGNPVAAVVAQYAAPYPGPGYEWVAGYYNGPQWIPGRWVHRVGSRARFDNHYGNRNARFDNRGRNNRTSNYDRNGYSNRDNHNGYANHNDRNGNNYGRVNRNGHDNRGGRH